MIRPSISMVLFVSLLSGCAAASGQEQEGSEAPPTAAAPPSQGASAKKPAAKGKAVVATRVEVARIMPSRTDLRRTLPGEVEGFRDAKLASSLGGFVERVLVKDGDVVKQGQSLVRIDSALHAARRDLAKADLDQAERELSRAEKLKEALAPAQREAAQTRALAAQAAYRTAEIQASRGVIRAPFGGVVAEVQVEPGEVAVPGAPLLRVVQLDPIKVTISVPDRDVVAITKGLSAKVMTDARAGVFEGKVARINPVSDTQTRTFKVDVEVPNADRTLLPGMIARVSLEAGSSEEQIVIPQYVLVTRRDSNGVFVIEKDIARWRPLSLGSLVGNQVVVEAGLAGGETVVVTGHRELADGDAVMVTREGTCCESGRIAFGAAR